MFAEDVDTFLADMGDLVTWLPSAGGLAKTGLMIFDQPTESIDGGDMLSRQYQVTLVVADWPGLKRGEVLVIGGTGSGASYRLRTDLQYQTDGVFAIAPVSKV